MTNLNLAGGGTALFIAGIGWAVAGLFASGVYGIIGAGLITVGITLIGLAPDEEDMALGPEDLEE